MASVPDNIDGTVHASRSASIISMMIQDPLVWSPKAGVFEPGLAKSWDISDDYTTVTLHLRDDVTFSDGEPFNAQAVKFTFDRIADPETNSLQAPTLAQLDNVEVVDDYTVKLTFKSPQPTLMDLLSSQAWSPVAPEAVAKLGKDFITNPVGTGPWMVKEWPTETSLTLVRNENYNWGPEFAGMDGKPYLKEIDWKFIEESTSRQLSLENGEVDMIQTPAWDELETMSQSDTYQVWSDASPGLPQVYNINVTVPPTNDLRVRQAMLYATNHEEISQVASFGYDPAAYGPLSVVTAGYDPAVKDMYPYDPDKAGQLLDEAGWKMNEATGIREKDGQPLTMRLVISDETLRTRAAELVQAQWKKVGIDLKVEIMAYAATVERYAANDYELGRLGWGSVDPYSALFTPFHSSNIEGGGQFNRSRISDAELDSLIDAIGSELDYNKRMQLVDQVELKVMDMALIVPVYETVYIWAGDKNIQNFQVTSDATALFHGVYLDPAK